MRQKTHDITIAVETMYIEEQSSPQTDHYVFAYTITIQNTGTVAARLLTRHWIITDANGKVREVKGEGVVGEQPYLQPLEAFRYTSAAVIETPFGTMQGSYEMIGDDGLTFDAPIRAFSLAVPYSLH